MVFNPAGGIAGIGGGGRASRGSQDVPLLANALRLRLCTEGVAPKVVGLAFTISPQTVRDYILLVT